MWSGGFAPTLGHSNYLTKRRGLPGWWDMAPTGRGGPGGMISRWQQYQSPVGLNATWQVGTPTGMTAAPTTGSSGGVGGAGAGWGQGYSGFADIAQQPGGFGALPGGAGGGGAAGNNSFMNAFNRAQAEQTNMANEARAFRGQAFQDLGRLVNTPAISRQAERINLNNMLSAARTREAGINQQNRDALNRAGLLTGGRGVDAARRTHAEMGPAVAQAVGQARLQRLLANSQALRQGLGARAAYAGSMPAVGEDMTSLMQLMAEMTNLQANREAAMKAWEAIKGFLPGAGQGGINPSRGMQAIGTLSAPASFPTPYPIPETVAPRYPNLSGLLGGLGL